jgi:hypothetical protein
MNTFSILFRMEFKRFWTAGMIVFAVGIIGVSIIPSIVTIQAGIAKNLSSIIVSTTGFLNFFTFLIFSAAIVSADIKSGWLRTLLIRSVTRQEYVVSKISVVFVSSLIVYILGIAATVAFAAFDPKIVITYDPAISGMIMLLKIGQLLLLIVLSTMISCAAPGAFNAFFVYVWMSLSQVVEFLVTKKYWDVKWAVVLKDYIFPDGFEQAQQAIVSQQQTVPVMEVLWGIAALAFFFGMTLHLMNRVVVDAGSE